MMRYCQTLKDAIERCKEYFEELMWANNQSIIKNKENNEQLEDVHNEISKEKVGCIKYLQIGKSVWQNNIKPEMVKYMGDSGT